MSSPAEEHYVVVESRELAWAIATRSIKEIVPEGYFPGGIVIDLARMWHIRDDSETARILVVWRGDGTFGVRAPHITYRTFSAASVSPIPPPLPRGGIVGIVFSESDATPPVVVLDPDRLVLGTSRE